MRELIDALPEGDDTGDFFDFHDFGLDEYQEEAADFAFYDGIATVRRGWLHDYVAILLL